MSLAARARLLAALTGLCAALGGATGLTGWAVTTAEPEHTVTLRFEDVGSMPAGITPETVAAAAPEGVPTWRPLEMVVTGRHLTIAEASGGTELPADVVLSTRDADAEYDPVHITSEFRRSAQVRSGAAARPGLFDEERLADEDTRWDVASAYAANRDLGHGAHAVVTAARTAGELTYDGPPREPLLYAGVAAALFALGLVPALLWARTVRRIERLRRRLRAARTDLAHVMLDLEAVEVAVLTTPAGAPGPDLRTGLKGLVRSALDAAWTEEELVRRMRRPDRAAPHDLEEHEQAVALLAGRAAALQETASLRSHHADAQTAADRLVAPIVLPAQAVLSRARTAFGPGAPPPRVSEAAAGLAAAVDDLLGAAVRAGTGSADRLGEGVLRAEGRIARAARDLVDALRDTDDAGALRIDGAVAEVRAVPPAEADVARREAAGLPAVGPEDPRQALAEAHASLLAVGQAGRAGRTRRSRTWPGRVLGAAVAALGCVLVAGLLTRPLAEAATAEPGWGLTGEHAAARITVDGLPQRGLTAQDLDEEGIRRHMEERLPDGLDVTVAVRPAESYLVPDPAEAAGEFTIPLDRPATLERLHGLKAEHPDLLDPGTGDLRPGQVLVPVLVHPGGGVSVDAPLTGALAYGTENTLGLGGHERTSVPAGADKALAPISVAWEVEGVARGIQAEGAFAPDVPTDTLWALLTASGAVVLGMLLLALRVGAGALARRLGVGAARADVARARRRLGELMAGLDVQRLDAVAVLGRGPAADAREAEQRLWESSLVAAWREADEIERLPLREQWEPEVRARAAALVSRAEDLAAHRDDVAARADAAVSR